MKRKKLIIFSILVILSGLLVSYILWWPENPAKSEANRILSGFETTTSSKFYCENDAGEKNDADVAWAEYIFVSDESIHAVSKKAFQHFDNQGYKQTSDFIEKSPDQNNLGKTYWELNGHTADFSSVVRVSQSTLTQNNCFNSSIRDQTINPESWESVIVIQFRNDQ